MLGFLLNILNRTFGAENEVDENPPPPPNPNENAPPENLPAEPPTQPPGLTFRKKPTNIYCRICGTELDQKSLKRHIGKFHAQYDSFRTKRLLTKNDPALPRTITNVKKDATNQIFVSLKTHQRGLPTISNWVPFNIVAGSRAMFNFYNRMVEIDRGVGQSAKVKRELQIILSDKARNVIVTLQRAQTQLENVDEQEGTICYEPSPTYDLHCFVHND